MDDLFSANYMALPGPGLFNTSQTREEQAQSYGIGLDQGYESRKAERKQQLPSRQQQFFFPQTAITYIRKSMPDKSQIELTTNGLTTFQADTQVVDPGKLAARIIEIHGLNGIGIANKTVQMVQAAMAIASRANEEQLRESGIGPGRRPGVLQDTFEHRKLDDNAPTFLGKLGRFIEPEYLRRNLIDYAQSNSTGHADPRFADAMELDQQPYEGNISNEAAFVLNKSTRQQIDINRSNAQIKFQRTMPHYSRIKKNHVLVAQATGDQFRMKNGFKYPITRFNRFTATPLT